MPPPKGSPATAASTASMQRPTHSRVQSTAPLSPSPSPSLSPSPSHWQTTMFRASALPMLSSILIASLLIELRVRLSTLLPEALDHTFPDHIMSPRANTSASLAWPCLLVSSCSHRPVPSVFLRLRGIKIVACLK